MPLLWGSLMRLICHQVYQLPSSAVIFSICFVGIQSQLSKVKSCRWQVHILQHIERHWFYCAVPSYGKALVHDVLLLFWLYGNQALVLFSLHYYWQVHSLSVTYWSDDLCLMLLSPQHDALILHVTAIHLPALWKYLSSSCPFLLHFTPVFHPPLSGCELCVFMCEHSAVLNACSSWKLQSVVQLFHV